MHKHELVETKRIYRADDVWRPRGSRLSGTPGEHQEPGLLSKPREPGEPGSSWKPGSDVWFRVLQLYTGSKP